MKRRGTDLWLSYMKGDLMVGFLSSLNGLAGIIVAARRAEASVFAVLR